MASDIRSFEHSNLFRHSLFVLRISRTAGRSSFEFRISPKGAMAAFRNLVHDVPESVTFYTSRLGFKLVEQYGPAMAILSRDDVTLWLAGPASSAARPLPNGPKPLPAGWNGLGPMF